MLELFLAWLWTIGAAEGLWLEIQNVRMAKELRNAKLGTNGFTNVMFKRDVTIEISRMVGLSLNLLVGLLALLVPDSENNILEIVGLFSIVGGGMSLIVNANVMYFQTTKMKQYT